LIFFQLLCLQNVNTTPPETSNTNRPINYAPSSETSYIGRKAPSLKDVAVGSIHQAQSTEHQDNLTQKIGYMNISIGSTSRSGDGGNTTSRSSSGKASSRSDIQINDQSQHLHYVGITSTRFTRTSIISPTIYQSRGSNYNTNNSSSSIIFATRSSC
jgi:hypothetical protein